jgi:hypothetical protein
MDLKDLFAISGKPGLYKYVSQTKNALIVESVTDNKRFPTYAAQKMMALEDISVYTLDEDVSLSEVLKKIYLKEDGGATAINPKADNEELKQYFLEILPDYDQDRVYVSDIKKIIGWYNFMQQHQLLKLKENPEKNEEIPNPDNAESSAVENTEPDAQEDSEKQAIIAEKEEVTAEK